MPTGQGMVGEEGTVQNMWLSMGSLDRAELLLALWLLLSEAAVQG